MSVYRTIGTLVFISGYVFDVVGSTVSIELDPMKIKNSSCIVIKLILPTGPINFSNAL